MVYFPQEVLDQMAELLDLECRIHDRNETHQFKAYAKDLFEKFQARQNQYLMIKVLEQEI